MLVQVVGMCQRLPCFYCSAVGQLLGSKANVMQIPCTACSSVVVTVAKGGGYSL